MNRLTDNKIVLVTRPTRLAELVVRFNTVSQARFYIEHLGADFKDYLREDETYHHALVEAQGVLGQLGRVQVIDRGFLPNFVFGPEDTIVTLGQDGLVANTIKYLNGQPLWIPLGPILSVNRGWRPNRLPCAPVNDNSMAGSLPNLMVLRLHD